jgi:hypothetical protein
MAVMAYVALVAAAIGSGNWLLADTVWAVTLFTLCYAIVVACFGRERQRSVALGFVVLVVGFVVCGYMSPGRLSTKRVLKALGYSVSIDGSLYARGTPQTVVTTETSERLFIPSVPGGKAIIDTVQAVGVMLAGLVGACIGAIAYNHSKRE